VSSLGLTWQSLDRGQLADGSETLFDVYDAVVLWDGRPRHVLVAESSTVPMIGMAMLSGFELRIQVRTGGSVFIEALAGPQAS
jgi:predicted aspartyl protease